MRKILFFAAEPTDEARLRVNKEFRDIRESWRLSGRTDDFQLDSFLASRPRDPRREILDGTRGADLPAVVHFSGHGAGAGGLILERDDGKGQLVSTDAVAGLFELLKRRVDCVVLDACLSDVQAKIINKSIPYVIGMRREIGDAAAILFSVGFYDAPFRGEGFARAFDFGCNAIKLESLPDEVKDKLTDRNVRPPDGTVVPAMPEDLKPKLYGPPAGAPMVVAGSRLGRFANWAAWVTVTLVTVWAPFVFGAIGLLAAFGVLLPFAVNWLGRRARRNVSAPLVWAAWAGCILVPLGVFVLTWIRGRIEAPPEAAELHFRVAESAEDTSGRPTQPHQGRWFWTAPGYAYVATVFADGYLPHDVAVAPWWRNRVRKSDLKRAPYLRVGATKNITNVLATESPWVLEIEINGQVHTLENYIGEYVLVGDTEHLPAWIPELPKTTPDGNTASYLRTSNRGGKPTPVSVILRPDDTVVFRPLKWQPGPGGATHIPLPSAVKRVPRLNVPTSTNEAVVTVTLDYPT